MTYEECIKTCEGYLPDTDARKMIIETLKNADKYKWHDLRENPNDLPEIDERVYIAVQMNGYISYIVESYTKSYSDLITLEWESDDYYKLNYVIAWRKIEPFEVEE